jgi:hypothetical protein
VGCIPGWHISFKKCKSPNMMLHLNGMMDNKHILFSTDAGKHLRKVKIPS